MKNIDLFIKLFHINTKNKHTYSIHMNIFIAIYTFFIFFILIVGINMLKCIHTDIIYYFMPFY